jgi:hypothetical protein
MYLLHSAVTDRTICELADFDVIRLHQQAPLGQLVGWRLPIGVEDLCLGSQVLLGRAVAIDTPAHRQRRDLGDLVHLADLAVACRAADALGHMDAVVEVDEIAQVMDAVPLDGLPVA